MSTDTIVNTSLATAVALIAIIRSGPATLRDSILRALRIQSQPNAQILLGRLKVLAGVSGVIAVNRLLNHLARNGWTLTKKSDWNWPNEVAVVTGGCGGIGANIVKGLAAKGVKVAVVDIAADLPPQLAKLSNVKLFTCDITTKENVDKVAAQIRDTLGNPSILCNNAGIAHAHTILETSPSYLKKLFDINVFCHFYLIQAFLPSMVSAKKGHIVTTCSMSSFVTPAGLVDYAASKAAVMALHEGLHEELKYRYDAPQIRTSIVHPTYVRTPLCDSYANALVKSKAVQLTPEFVGAQVVNAILSGSSQQIVLPRSFAITSALRALPWWFQEIIRGTTKEDMKRI